MYSPKHSATYKYKCTIQNKVQFTTLDNKYINPQKYNSTRRIGETQKKEVRTLAYKSSENTVNS